MELWEVRSGHYIGDDQPDHPMEYWWRCDSYAHWHTTGDDISVSVSFTRYYLQKHTPKGAWLGSYHNDHKSGWNFCLKSGRKRFAYPTKAEAFDSFQHRTGKRVIHCQNTLSKARAIKRFIDDTPWSSGAAQ